jgi:dipeptidyl aminopeptidase/acylaminoacyl peptidase
LRVSQANDPIALLLGAKASRELEDSASPITYAHRNFPPTLLIHGNADTIVPVDASFEMYRALSGTGAEVELHVYDGVPHAFDAAPDLGRQVTDLIALFLDRKVANPPIAATG